jgi:hypothetical protein
MRTTIGYMLTLAWLCGCSTGSSSSDNAGAATPYQLGQALVIGETRGGELMNVDGTCDTDVCREVIERCGEDAYADVVVDADGNVLDVLCFRGNAEVREIGPEAVATASAGNNTVLVLDGADDGPDVTGDVVLTGNNAVIYGRGADVSEIGGDLAIDKNNAIVRGVTIQGDVRIDKNNAQLSFTEIHGDLTIDGNNTTLAECVVHGQVIINGVNTVLVQNRFLSESALSGKNLECNGNVSVSAQPAGDAGTTTGDSDGGASDAGVVEAELICENERGPAEDRGRP